MKYESLIFPEIIKAYRETEFRVFVDDVVVLALDLKAQAVTADAGHF